MGVPNKSFKSRSPSTGQSTPRCNPADRRELRTSFSGSEVKSPLHPLSTSLTTLLRAEGEAAAAAAWRRTVRPPRCINHALPVAAVCHGCEPHPHLHLPSMLPDPRGSYEGGLEEWLTSYFVIPPSSSPPGGGGGVSQEIHGATDLTAIPQEFSSHCEGHGINT